MCSIRAAAWLTSDLSLVELHQNGLIGVSAVIEHQVGQQGEAVLRGAGAAGDIVLLGSALSCGKLGEKETTAGVI